MFITSPLYKQDIENISSGNIDWNFYRNKKILITGGNGLIGSFLIDLLMHRNIRHNDNIGIYTIGRNRQKTVKRFKDYFGFPCFDFIEHDLLHPLNRKLNIDFVIHGASNTHPRAYASAPIDTILVSVYGTKNILDFSFENNVKRVLFLSSVEIYGSNRGDVELFDENYCGYIDPNTIRAGYPEGKRAAESLCQAYICQKNLDILIARCSRVYGPTMGDDDSKAIAQFLRNAAINEDIVLKSKGGQLFSYCYVADVCSALLYLLPLGDKGNAYNIAGPDLDTDLRQIALLLASFNNTKLKFEEPSNLEAMGFSKASKALLDSSKIEALGWHPLFNLHDGLERTVAVLKQMQSK
ncbi:MAG: NAD-dependent epimerase/dehydratase family protein [Treponema sp.]|jgi:nucleoside-diphosphate-sugar epimerase|nr:NAD-dependent epimerase/dehydratase family protein [Treponema sp.]